MKKTYLKPTTMVVQIYHRQQLLGGSPYGNIQSPVKTYDDDNDVIDQKGNIW
jgi:hypothetical protein